MVPIQNAKMTVGLIWNTGGTETEIIVPVSVLGPQRAGTEVGGDRTNTRDFQPKTIYDMIRWNIIIDIDFFSFP